MRLREDDPVPFLQIHPVVRLNEVSLRSREVLLHTRELQLHLPRKRKLGAKENDRYEIEVPLGQG